MMVAHRFPVRGHGKSVLPTSEECGCTGVCAAYRYLSQGVLYSVYRVQLVTGIGSACVCVCVAVCVRDLAYDLFWASACECGAVAHHSECSYTLSVLRPPITRGAICF